MAETITKVTSLQQFREIISRDRVSIFDFWASWCGPCIMIGPEFEGHSKNKQYTAGADFYKVDVDANPDISEEVGIRAMPTFVIFKNGVKVDTMVGADKGKLQNFVAAAAEVK